MKPHILTSIIMVLALLILASGIGGALAASPELRFSAPLRLPLNVAAVSSVAVGDFNGDGRPDVCAGHNIGSFPNYPARVAVFLQQSSNSYSVPTILAPGPTCWMTDTLETADLNRDSKADLILMPSGTASGCFGNHFVSMLGNGTGTFAAPGVDHTTGGSPGNPGLGDFNGDGILDVAIVTADASTLRLHRGRGDGTFEPWTVTPSTTLTRNRIAVARLDADPFLDVVVGTYVNNQVEVLFGKGDGTFDPSIKLEATNGLHVATEDFNNDGLADIVVTTYTVPGTLLVFLNLGNRQFSNPRSWSLGRQTELGGIATGDLNGDGRLDVVVSANDGSLHTLPGDGQGHFDQPVLLATNEITSSRVRIADMNGDGLPDVVAPSYGSQSGVVVFFNELARPRLEVRCAAGLAVSGEIGRDYRIDYATVLGNGEDWSALQTIRLTNNPTWWIDTDSLAAPHRFYRAVEVP